MVKYQIDANDFASWLEPLGMSVFGTLQLSADLIPEGSGQQPGCSAILIGSFGDQMWDAFERSREHSDGLPDPMDRWTRRSIDKLASSFDVDAVYPFDRPFWPFQKIAAIAVDIHTSPLGLLVHPVFGLWQAYRALLILKDGVEISNQFSAVSNFPQKLIHPCNLCESKPCLSACPANAFDGESLVVDRCFDHLDSRNNPDCMKSGCRARDVCPVGQEYRYSEDQIMFHMSAFKK